MNNGSLNYVVFCLNFICSLLGLCCFKAGSGSSDRQSFSKEFIFKGLVPKVSFNLSELYISLVKPGRHESLSGNEGPK